MAMLYLFAPSSGLYSCPLAMTDGAASLIKSIDPNLDSSELRNAFNNLTSNNPD